jgi:hypothetical protein
MPVQLDTEYKEVVPGLARGMAADSERIAVLKGGCGGGVRRALVFAKAGAQETFRSDLGGCRCKVFCANQSWLDLPGRPRDRCKSRMT